MDDIISSSQNPNVKHLKKLYSSAKYRQEQSLAVADGIHLVKSFLGAGLRAEQIICAQSALKNQEIIEVFKAFAVEESRVLALKDSLFESICQVHAAVGVALIFQPQNQLEAGPLSQNALLLEAIQDPGNLGTIMRTAAAAGVKQVYLSANCTAPYSPKALRAGMGAQFSQRIYEYADLPSLVSGSKIPVLATDLSAKSSLYEMDLTADVAWVFGSEGQGVSPQLLAVCTTRIKIPQIDNTVESLNVSAAVAVCVFEKLRQTNSNLAKGCL